ncbi:MAG: hypothetical protein AAGF45_02425, partial [Pseudomonadota bacterium]
METSANAAGQPAIDPSAPARPVAAMAPVPGMSAAEVDAFIARGPFPRVSPGNAQFAFRGNTLSLELVRWIHAGVSRSAFIRVPGTDLW